jgi:hypothetical protein
MTSLDKARKGRSAIRQIKSLKRAHLLTPQLLDQLLETAEEGFSQMMGEQPATPAPPSLTVHTGGRA